MTEATADAAGARGVTVVAEERNRITTAQAGARTRADAIDVTTGRTADGTGTVVRGVTGTTTDAGTSTTEEVVVVDATDVNAMAMAVAAAEEVAVVVEDVRSASAVPRLLSRSESRLLILRTSFLSSSASAA